MPRYYLYITSSYTRTLYIGVTNNLLRRIGEHKSHLIPGFTSQYQVDRLVYFEEYADVREAIAREKQVKRWSRAKKEHLIESVNPQWEDLGLDL
jgi:putative endonuclease